MSASVGVSSVYRGGLTTFQPMRGSGVGSTLKAINKGLRRTKAISKVAGVAGEVAGAAGAPKAVVKGLKIGSKAAKSLGYGQPKPFIRRRK